MSSCRTDGPQCGGDIRAFILSRNADMVLGPRRMPRIDFVEKVRETAREMGISVGPIGSGCAVAVFDHGSEIPRDIDPGETDVLFGQDLCHQVPAVVRMRPHASGDDRLTERSRGNRGA